MQLHSVLSVTSINVFTRFSSNIRSFLLTMFHLSKLSAGIICIFAFYLHCLYNFRLSWLFAEVNESKRQEQWFEYFWILLNIGVKEWLPLRNVQIFQTAINWLDLFLATLSVSLSVTLRFVNSQVTTGAFWVLTQASHRDHATYMTRRDTKSPLVITQNLVCLS